MLSAGFYTENLLYLAGENEHTNQFELQKIASRALDELGLDYSDREIVVRNYICYLLDEAISEKQSYESVLRYLKDLCIDLDYESSLYDFYSLYFAQHDLSYSTHQWYWENANRENIDQIIKDYFHKRKNNCT